jgi:elongation factor G
MFSGVIDLISFKARMYHEETFGATFDDIDIPQDLLELANKYRTQMLEAVSDVDDTLLEKYLEGKEISVEGDKKVLKKLQTSLK